MLWLLSLIVEANVMDKKVMATKWSDSSAFQALVCPAESTCRLLRVVALDVNVDYCVSDVETIDVETLVNC